MRTLLVLVSCSRSTPNTEFSRLPFHSGTCSFGALFTLFSSLFLLIGSSDSFLFFFLYFFSTFVFSSFSFFTVRILARFICFCFCFTSVNCWAGLVSFSAFTCASHHYNNFFGILFAGSKFVLQNCVLRLPANLMVFC